MFKNLLKQKQLNYEEGTQCLTKNIEESDLKKRLYTVIRNNGVRVFFCPLSAKDTFKQILEEIKVGIIPQSKLVMLYVISMYQRETIRRLAAR